MKVTECEIFNQIDSKYYTLYVEWYSLYFKVILLEPTMPPLIGEMGTDNVIYFCNELSKSTDEYLEETKKILCGKDSEIQFSIENEILQWKSKSWILGKIQLRSISDIQVICGCFQQLLKLYQNIRDRIDALEEENKYLTVMNKELNVKVEKMIEVKTGMEQDLYKKFIAILNSKKKKIRELESAASEEVNTKESIFNAPTDESEESEKEDNSKVPNKSGKRKSLHGNSPDSLQKNRKIDFNTKKGEIQQASSSTDFVSEKIHTVDDYETTEAKCIRGEQSSNPTSRKSRTSLTFFEEESDEDLFSQ